MTNRLKRLELTWIGKEDGPRLEPRILLEDEELSYAKRVSNEDVFDNRLIHGDNLLALKALEQEFTGKIKCVYIDPPYNTGSAFEHYDDGLEHSVWLSLMRDRLELLRNLLREDGVLFVQVDDNEQAYLRVMMDEVFGRNNFISTVSVQMSVAAGLKTTHAERTILKICEYIHVYARDASRFAIADLRYIRSGKSEYDLATRRDRIILNPEDPVGEWRFETVRSLYATEIGSDGYARINEFVQKYADRMYTFIENASSRRYWERLSDAERKATRDRVRHIVGEKTKYLYAYNEAVLLPYYADSNDGNLWLEFHNLGRTAESEGGVSFKNGKKPEKLLERIIGLTTRKGDIVLDSFAGSGTTGAVAHKMGRRWIMVELREHCETLVAPRIRRVIDGGDPTGVTTSSAWKGGGGFRFYKLAPSLLEKDKWGNWIVTKQYKPEMLAEAMCKLEGFRYAPDREVFWNHGHSTERDFIYVTTQNLSPDQLRFISDQVGSERTLLICCGAFRGKPEFPNLTVKKIPQAVLARCEWGRDDYSLNVTEQAPVIAVEEAKAEASSNNGTKANARRRKKPAPMQALPLFAGIDKGSR